MPLDFLRASLSRLSTAQPGRLAPMVQAATAVRTLTLTLTLTLITDPDPDPDH